MQRTYVSCRAEEGYLPWGSFDVRYASPQVVAASLTQTAAPFSAAADLWSLGMILYEVAAGIPYWQGYNHLEVVNCLLGLTRLPHEADDNCLARCAGVRPSPPLHLLSCPWRL